MNVVIKYKSWDEWRVLINNSLSSTQFQDLIYDLLKALHFSKVDPRGPGPDGNRDFDAEYIRKLKNGEQEIVSCRVQCKKWGSGIPYAEISEDIITADDTGIDEYYIVSNWELTPSCCDSIKLRKGKRYTKVYNWTGLKFKDILFSHPDICKKFFPDEEVPPLPTQNISNDVLRLTNDSKEQYGFEINLQLNKGVDSSNTDELVSQIKDALLKLKIDDSMKSIVYEKMAMFFFGLKKFDDAILFLNKTLVMTPENLSALLNKGYIFEKIGKLDESNKIYDLILEINAENIFALNNKSSNLLNQGSLNEALELVETALTIDPSFIPAINNKCAILKNLRKYDEALKFLESNQIFVNQFVKLQLVKVDVLIDQLDLKAAYELNQSIISRNPSNLDALNNLGVIYERNSRFQKRDKYWALALDCFEKALELDKNYSIGWANKIAIIVNLKPMAEAQTLIDLCVSLFPDDPHILEKKGTLLLELQPPQSKEAMKYIDKALRNSYNERFILSKIRALLIMKHYEEAKKLCEQLLNISPKNPESWHYKGCALRGLHQTTLAKKCFKNAEEYKQKYLSLLEDS